MDKIIIPMSYMGSGSSAVTDLLREYEGINTKNSDFEYVFLHAPDGLFDLEYKLLYNNNVIRSDEAVKSFRKLMKNCIFMVVGELLIIKKKFPKIS